MIAFDIETCPVENIAELVPAFDEADVRVGNLKDAEKIAAKIAAAKKIHADAFIGRAALSATTGRVLAVGYCGESVSFSVIGGREVDILRDFWKLASDCYDRIESMIGQNIFQFDLPFLVRRSWILGTPVPQWVLKLEARFHPWSDLFVDLRLVWQLGDKQAESSFDVIDRALGGKGKEDGLSGADFARLWSDDRPRALAYLKSDCTRPLVWANRVGLEFKKNFSF